MSERWSRSATARLRVVARGIVADELAGLRARFGHHESKGGAQSEGLTCDQVVDYVMSGYAGLTERFGPSRIEGARILEVGPGDNQALALCFLAAGASEVIGLDRFRVAHDQHKQHEVYATLLSRMSDAERAALESVIDVGQDPAGIDGGRLKLIAGASLEEAVSVLEPESFDLIFSVAVGEHLYDSDLAFDAMDRLLDPGGAMIHQIDLNDHGIFTAHGLHPLTWLTVPDWAYNRMVAHRGGPNRRLVDYYRNKMESLGYKYTMLASGVVGEDGLHPYPAALLRGKHYQPHHERLVDEIRPKLLARYRALADVDLMTAGLLLIASK